MQADIRKNFNSHAHVERDDSTNELTDSMKNFNSHAHVERDVKCTNMGLALLISTHTLTWSVTCDRACLFLVLKFQLTRSRGA